MDDTYAEIQQFYARQMRLLDHGAAEEWAATFTTDGVFADTGGGALCGRSEIAAAARNRVDQVAAAGHTRRHWLGMLSTEPAPDGAVVTRYYAFAMRTGGDRRPDLYASTECADVLVRTPGVGWLVRHRLIHHDGSGPADQPAPVYAGSLSDRSRP